MQDYGSEKDKITARECFAEWQARTQLYFTVRFSVFPIQNANFKSAQYLQQRYPLSHRRKSTAGLNIVHASTCARILPKSDRVPGEIPRRARH